MTKTELTPLAIRLKKIREQRGFTQEQVSEKINVEIGTLSGYERAYRKPSPEMLLKLADLYVCSTDYLLGRVDSPTDELSSERSASDRPITIALSRTDNPYDDLPDEAQQEIENFIAYTRQKYKKQD